MPITATASPDEPSDYAVIGLGGNVIGLAQPISRYLKDAHPLTNPQVSVHGESSKGSDHDLLRWNVWEGVDVYFYRQEGIIRFIDVRNSIYTTVGSNLGVFSSESQLLQDYGPPDVQYSHEEKHYWVYEHPRSKVEEGTQDELWMTFEIDSQGHVTRLMLNINTPG